jgi:isoquinoline 1-oxidoreductase beta subunit
MSHAGVSRRDFLKTGSAALGGLLVGFHLPGRTAAAQAPATAAVLNAWIHIGTDDVVTLFVHKAEMGQGTTTSLPMLLAEELECDWTKVRTEFPGVDPAYGMQGVFGSNSIRQSWTPLRTAGARARTMLIAAAAQRWNVAPAECRAENGFVIDRAGQRLSFGALAHAASKLPAPETVALKDPSAFRLIGRPLKRLDTPAKVDGSARFGIDVRLPNMLHAVVARCPVVGGTLKAFDATKANAIAGVRHVAPISTGVVVIADNTWTAMQARAALDITWDEGPNASRSSANIREMFAAMAERPGLEARRDGDAAAVLARTATTIDRVYEAPYAAHVMMEPISTVADVRADGCDVYAATQVQTFSRNTAATASGLPREKVRVHTTFLGSGLGRRSRTENITEAVEASKLAGAPVKVTWSREDDIQRDHYRPAAYVRFSASLDANGWPEALQARIVCPSFANAGPNGVDHTAVEGIEDLQYAIPHVLVEYHKPDAGIPTHYWRSVGYSQNTFFLESFLDELPEAGKKDPLELRLRLLAGAPRMRRVLEVAAERAGWGRPLAAGRGRGLSVVNNIGSYTAQVAEVSVAGGALTIHRVVCAVDCGHIVNPAILEQQMIGGIGTGLSAALKDAITIERGRVQQSNFHDYRIGRINELPPIEVVVVPSVEDPGGIGEASTPGIAPAVANAIFAAARKRVRRLPIRPADLA